MIPLLTRLAFRNLGRHRRRTFLIGLGVAVGVAIVTIQTGLVAGVRHQMIDRLVVAQFGHVTLVADPLSELPGAAPPKGLIADPAAATDLVHRVYPSARIAASLSTLGMAFGELSGSVRVVLWGVAEGEPMLPGRRIDGNVYVGAKLAEQLEVRAGDSIAVSAVDPDGNLEAMDFEVAEVLERGAPWHDYFVYLPLEALQSMLGVDRAVDSLRVYLPGGFENAADATLVLNQAIAGQNHRLRAEPYQQAGRLFMGIITASKIQASVVEIILLIAVALGVGSAQILSIHERRREIGTMRALGTSRGAIRALFLIEGAVLSTIAGLLGAAAGLTVTVLLGAVGIETGIEAFRWMIGGARLVPRVDSLAVVWVLLELIVVVTLSGLYPAWRAARLNPAGAMQEATG